MQRFSRLWWASILLSSVVTGGGSFALLSLLTGLPVETIVKVSVASILLGDIALALLMESVSPTRVLLGPGDRRSRTDPLLETGTVIGAFENGSGCVSIRGERWRAMQASGCEQRLEPGARVRVLERQGLTLIVAAADRS